MTRTHSLRNVTPSAALLAAVLLTAVAPPALAARDGATALPADTLLYVGWNNGLKSCGLDCLSPERVGDAVVSILRLKDEEAQRARLAVRLLMRAAGGSAGIGLLGVSFGEGEPVPQFAAVLDVGDDAAGFLRDLETLIREAGVEEPTEYELSGATLRGVEPGDAPPVLWGEHRGVLVFALGKAPAEKVIRCLDGQAESLAASAEFKRCRGKVPPANGTGDWWIEGYADLRGMVDRVIRPAIADAAGVAEAEAEGLGPTAEFDAVMQKLGLGGLRSFIFRMDSVEYGQRSVSYLGFDGREGVLKLFDQKPVREEDLKIVPRDAYWCAVWNLDLASLWREARRIIVSFSPEAERGIDDGLALARGFLGFSITDDLLANFGDTWALFDAPDHGGILVTGVVLVSEVKDAEVQEEIVARLVELLVGPLDMASVKLQRRTMSAGAHTVNYVVLGGVPSPFAPAWATVGDRWVLGLMPHSVAAAVRQVDPATRQASILEHPDVVAARKLLPREFTSFSTVDTGYLTRVFYPFIAHGLTALISWAGGGTDVDLAMVPSRAEMLAQARHAVAVRSLVDDGMLDVTVGGGNLMPITAGGAALLAGTMVPSLVRARELARRTVVMSNMRHVAVACHMYANEHDDKFPESLDDLVAAGYLPEDLLLDPTHPLYESSFVYIHGQTAASDPRNVLIWRRPSGHEGTLAAFVDGHAEWVELWRLHNLLYETYDRLDRLDEMPETVWP